MISLYCDPLEIIDKAQPGDILDIFFCKTTAAQAIDQVGKILRTSQAFRLAFYAVKV